MRTDPWPLPLYKDKAMELADLLGASGPAQAARLFEALSQPFALRAVEDRRLELMALLSRQLNFAGLCGKPVGLLDRHPLWDAGFLRLRMDCYRVTNDPRLDRAISDLEDFFSGEDAPLGAGIVKQ
jgi:hypothetical protein